HACGQAHESAGRDNHFFGETAIALDAEDFAAQAHGLFAATAEFAFAAENVGLDGDGIAGFPFGSASVSLAWFGTCRRDAGAPRFADLDDFSGNFAAGNARELYGDGQTGFLQPKVKMIQAAGLHLDDDF